MEKGKPYLRNRTMYPWVRTVRLWCCLYIIWITFNSLILYPVKAMSHLQMQFTIDEWLMVIAGVIVIQIIMLSMYREIKYGGYKRGK